MSASDRDTQLLVDAIVDVVDKAPSDLEEAVRACVDAWVAGREDARRSTRDELTDLFNREMFSEDLDRLVAGAHRVGMPALLVADVDHFHAIVQKVGEAAGNTVLKRVAACLREASRAEDLVARVEGDTFAVLIPGPIHAEAAVAIGERFQAVVRSDEWLQSLDVDVTISVGVAWSPEMLDAVHLLSMGQHAMRTAKDHGRGTVEFVTEPLTPPMSEVA